MTAQSGHDDGSFRDPDSAVFHHHGRILRGLSERASNELSGAQAKGLLADLEQRGLLVTTTDVELDSADTPMSPRGGQWARVVEHERIPLISYPFEWPFGMLKTAAICHLDVLIAALESGYSLKDGTAYNVVFRGIHPIFIDVGSFEKAKGPWPGYRQFCQTMLFPLLIQAHLEIAPQPLLRGALDGLPPSMVAAMFSGKKRFAKGVLRNVTLHAMADRSAGGSSESVQGELAAAGLDERVALASAKKLRTLVEKLTVQRDSSVWADYRSTCSYSDEDTVVKRNLIEAAGVALDGGTVLDVGANDGAFSRLVAPHADQVIAIDFDELVIDRLYRDLSEEGIANVTPLVMNLVDPSPAMGWRNRERPSFDERVDADLVLALALVHHLAIGANIPLPSVVDWLRAYDAPTIAEFVHRDDPMVKTLLSQKPKGLFDDYTLDAFIDLVGEQFVVESRTELPSGTRTLFELTPK